MENLEYWNKLSRPPASALKPITGGRMSGKTDINPQWRYKAMTELFGPVGFGWTYTIEKQWVETGASGETMAFCNVSVIVNQNGEWSKPVPGTGGSTLIQSEKSGPRSNDEAFKMALTDALSVALKMLGVAADIYAGLWDGAKYKTDAPQTQSPAAKSAARQETMTLQQAMDTISSDGKRYGDRLTEELVYVVNNPKSPADKKQAAKLIIDARNKEGRK